MAYQAVVDMRFTALLADAPDVATWAAAGPGTMRGLNRLHGRPVDALIIAPATYNTINKLALGIADTYVLTTAAETIGRGVPTVIVPFVNTAFAARKPFLASVESLRQEGVAVILGSRSSRGCAHPSAP